MMHGQQNIKSAMYEPSGLVHADVFFGDLVIGEQCRAEVLET
jgi:hypothetical protein